MLWKVYCQMESVFQVRIVKITNYKISPFNKTKRTQIKAWSTCSHLFCKCVLRDVCSLWLETSFIFLDFFQYQQSIRIFYFEAFYLVYILILTQLYIYLALEIFHSTLTHLVIGSPMQPILHEYTNHVVLRTILQQSDMFLAILTCCTS